MDSKTILQKMTLKEKIALCSGQDFWHTKAMKQYGIEALMMCDGPHGLRKQEGKADMLGVHNSREATCFPTAVTTACTWNPELMEIMGQTIAEEALAYGVDIVLGPGVNIKRNPLCGRNFEYFSEDPYLAGKLVAGWIREMEGAGIALSLKHFACNSQEWKRFSSDSIVDERTLREIYLYAFELAVKEGHPSTVMCAYNKINGVHCSDDKRLLTDILRREWGFDGLVVTDWGAMNDRIQAFQAGCDLNMPGGSAYMERETEQAVKSGILSEKSVDASALRVLNLMQKCVANRLVYDRKTTGVGYDQMITEREAPAEKMASSKYDAEVHHDIARQVAEEGIVLLKNEDQILPLQQIDDDSNVSMINMEEIADADMPIENMVKTIDSDACIKNETNTSNVAKNTVALIGNMAQNLRYQGAGSSHINPTKLQQLVDVLPHTVFAEGCDAYGNTTEKLLEKAKVAARQCEKVVLCVGLPERYESEGFDRGSLKLPEGHLRLINAVTEENANTIVILMSGGVVECPWAGKVKGILYAGLSGQAGAQAIANILYGKVNPSGKLAESWPINYEDCATAAFYGKEKDAIYREGIYVGYRYYDKIQLPVRWCFGYGLSYTTFAYSNLKIQEPEPSEQIRQLQKNNQIEKIKRLQKDIEKQTKDLKEEYVVSCDITNTGALPGKEIVQLYVSAKTPEIHRPVRELKGFSKVYLMPGETKQVQFLLTDRDFCVYADGWKSPRGRYTIELGTSSRDIRLSETIHAGTVDFDKNDDCADNIKQSEFNKMMISEKIPDQTTEHLPKQLSDEVIQAVMQRKPHHKGTYTMEDSVEEMQKDVRFMRVFYKAADWFIRRSLDGTITDENEAQYRMMLASSMGSPMRTMMICGGIRGGLIPGVLDLANGHVLRGIGKMCGIVKSNFSETKEVEKTQRNDYQ